MELTTELNWLDKFPNHTIVNRIKSYLNEYGNLKTRNKELMRVLNKVNIEQEIEEIKRMQSLNEHTAVNHIREAVFRATGIKNLSSSRRQREYVDARFIFSHLCRKYTMLSLPEIGKELSRDHSTIIHAVRTAKHLIEFDEEFRTKYAYAETYIKNIGLSKNDYAEIRQLRGHL